MAGTIWAVLLTAKVCVAGVLLYRHFKSKKHAVQELPVEKKTKFHYPNS